MKPTGALRLAQAPLERRYAVAGEPAVGLDLGLPRPPRSDPAVDPARAEPLEVGPEPTHSGEVVLELRELDLELALGAARVVGEDVEDDRRAVDHRHAERLLEVALLAWHELVIARHEVGAGVGDRPPQLGQLSAAEVAVGIGALPALDKLTGDRHAGRPQQLAQLAQIRFARGGRDAQGPLPRPPIGYPLAVSSFRHAAVSVSIHCVQSRPRMESRPRRLYPAASGSRRRSTGGRTPRLENSSGTALPGSTTTPSSGSPSQEAWPTA
jgi:hypothetical protein